jgi:Ca2+-binding EF-hand superfamily protein
VRKLRIFAFIILAAAILPAATTGQRPEHQKKKDAGPRRSPLPGWFYELDADGDGQIGLHEWRDGGNDDDEFRKYDLNGDGFITAEELRRYLETPVELQFQNGQANYKGAAKEADEEYRGKKSFKILSIKLEQGQTYRINHRSQAFQAFLYLEDSSRNLLAENSSPNVGGNSQIVFRAAKSGLYRLIATSQGGYRTGDFSLSVRVGRILPKGLPSWFEQLDQDGDGQVGVHEWRAAGRDPEEFRKYDLNADGFITVEELLHFLKKPVHLQLKNGRVVYNGAVKEADQEYRRKKSYKIFTIRLEHGRTYQFDLKSAEFQSFLFLEDFGGNLLAENSSENVGAHSRLVFRAGRTGTYRVIATSLGGYRTGNIVLSVRFDRILPKSLTWFEAMDADGDGQIGLYEWRAAGKDLDEFRRYDLNGDGFITADEFLRFSKMPLDLQIDNSYATYTGVIKEADEEYRGKRSYKIFTIRLDYGRTYQIEHMSKAFHAFLFLEDSEGKPLAENASPEVGDKSRIVFHASKAGVYRIIATSGAGVRTGDFTLSVSIEHVLSGFQRNGLPAPKNNQPPPKNNQPPPKNNQPPPKGLPSWFKELDTDGDGQIGLYEWEAAGGEVDDFEKFDLNGDGFITAAEVLRFLNR